MLPQEFEFFKENSFMKNVKQSQNKVNNSKQVTKVCQAKYAIALFGNFGIRTQVILCR